MKDSILLLVVGLIMSAFAWAFWHYLDKDAFDVFSIIALITLFCDNARLRKKLKANNII
jgi:hypothetical protein